MTQQTGVSQDFVVVYQKFLTCHCWAEENFVVGAHVSVSIQTYEQFRCYSRFLCMFYTCHVGFLSVAVAMSAVFSKSAAAAAAEVTAAAAAAEAAADTGVVQDCARS